MAALPTQLFVVPCLLISALAPGFSHAQQSPSVGGRWSSLFKVAPSWTGVHSALLRGNGETERPLSFALYQSRPNPSRSGALVPFDLPRTMAVRLEVFDPQGRRVYRRQQETLLGHHEWAVAGSGSTALAPGVYSYRLKAGPYQAQRKMVVLP